MVFWKIPGNNEDTTKKVTLSGWLNNEKNPLTVDNKLEGSFSVTSVSSDNKETTNKVQIKKEKQSDSEQSIINLQYNESIKAYTYGNNVLEALSEFIKMTEGNLLYIYVSDYLPLIKQIIGEKDSDNGIDYKQKVLDFINTSGDNIKIENTDAYVLDFTINPNSESPTKFSIDFDPDDTNNILDVIIKDFSYNGCLGNISFSLLKNFNNSDSTSFKSNDNIGYVDLSTLPLLTKIGIKTTERRDYEIEGSLIMKTSGVATWIVDVDIKPTVKVYLKVGDTVDKNNLFTIDGLVEIYYTTDVTDTSTLVNTSATRTYSTIVTQYFIKDTDAYIKKDKKSFKSTGSRKTIFSSWTWSDYTLTNDDLYYVHLDQATMVQDMLYYIMVFSLEQESVYEKIKDMANENSIDLDNMLGYFKYFKKIDNENKYQLYMRLVVLDVYADLYYFNEEGDNQYLLSRFHVYSSFNIGLGSIKLDLDVSNNTTISSTYYNKMVSTSTYTSEYEQFFTDWDNDSNLNNLQLRTDYTNNDSSVLYHVQVK